MVGILGYERIMPPKFAVCFNGKETGCLNGMPPWRCSSRRDEDGDEDGEWLGDKYLIHYFDYETGTNKYLIWGLTARTFIRAVSLVYQRPLAFLEQNPKFKVPRVVNKDTVMP